MENKHYDTGIINSVLEDFKAHHYSPEQITICWDIDNTLGRFNIYGRLQDSLDEMYTEGFYKRILCFSEGPTVIRNLQRMGFTNKIVSSYIDSPYCPKEKREWVHYYYDTIKDRDIILVPNGKAKTSIFKDIKQLILVDDFHGNIMPWYAAGGVAVKKSYSGKQRPVPMITNLIDIFSVLRELNIR